MLNYIQFALYDIVCIRPEYNTPMGEKSTALVAIEPLEVVDIYEDSDAEIHEGPLGSTNGYRVRNIIKGWEIFMYQYELMLWKDIKEEVILAHKDVIMKLEGID